MPMTREQAIEALRKQSDGDAGHDARYFLEHEKTRHGRFSVEAGGLFFDFSKHPISIPSLDILCKLATDLGLQARIDAMARGDIANVTENRAAQHMALRGGGKDDARKAQANRELSRALAFSDDLRSGTYTSSTGEAFTHILHIGIGGSDLGPRLVHDALSSGHAPIDVRFLSSIDPDAFERAVFGLDPATTLVFVVSKSFGTPETSLNTKTSIAWLEAGLDGGIGRHLSAATANGAAARALGISDDRIFEMGDWVGGRYSLWSSVSLSVMAAIGREAFNRLLRGARQMDEHFLQSRMDTNAPVLSALIIWWYRTICGCQSWATVPYSSHLGLFANWLKQLSMESLGKSVDLDGGLLGAPAGPVVWGGEGPDAQHAFFQLLHQGKDVIPVDLIAFAKGGDGEHRRALLANAVAQAEALLSGRDADSVRGDLEAKGVAQDDIARMSPHMVMPGGRGSTFILAETMDAAALGALLAFYEHQTFALSLLFGINAFDQFGVELGKNLARTLESEWTSGAGGQHDASTNALIARIQSIGDQ
ncbi:MAG: glucose-6-phosphate isomerase [Hyphobacterium sp.]|nr:MAG: glucose-6-phosphate isomerase [Hyphobacterium sp.]